MGRRHREDRRGAADRAGRRRPAHPDPPRDGRAVPRPPDVPGLLDVHHLCQRVVTGLRKTSMKRSTDRILTTHVGSLARPHELLDTLKEKENGRPYDADLLARQITEAVADRVRHQVESGIDIVTDGEM